MNNGNSLNCDTKNLQLDESHEIFESKNQSRSSTGDHAKINDFFANSNTQNLPLLLLNSQVSMNSETEHFQEESKSTLNQKNPCSITATLANDQSGVLNRSGLKPRVSKL